LRGAEKREDVMNSISTRSRGIKIKIKGSERRDGVSLLRVECSEFRDAIEPRAAGETGERVDGSMREWRCSGFIRAQNGSGVAPGTEQRLG